MTVTPIKIETAINISKGEIVCLCGESGCGKSSLLKAIQGFAESTGLIEVAGDILDENTVDTIRQKTAYVPQDLSLPYDTVEQMVMSLFELRVNRNIKFSKDSIFTDWTLLGLDNSLWNKQVNEISGGQRQRIMLTIAGLTGKQLLLADEPTSALDPELTGEVLRVIRNLADQNTTMIIVTHEMAFARDVADKVIFMDGGVIVEQGDPRQVIDHPQEERTKQFLSRYSEN